MPFHVKCLICNKMIAKGVRFNSNRKKCGRYLGTIIYKFSMSCPYCKSEIIIKTDPKNCEYLLVKGVVKYLYFREDEKEIKYDDDNNDNQYEIEKMFCEKIDKIKNVINNDDDNNNNIDCNFVFDIYKIKNEEKDFFKLNKIMRENLRKEKEFYVNKEEYYNIKFKHLNNNNNNKLLNKKRMKMENNNNNNNKNYFINNIFNYKIKNKIQLKKI